MSAGRHTISEAMASAPSRRKEDEARDPRPGEGRAPPNSALSQALVGGSPLDPQVRAEMESRFGTDFGAVRIHDRPPAHRAAQQQHAQAFTLGTHVVFNRGRYQPSSVGGKRLLAHELAHVVQQDRGGPQVPPFEGGALEQSADRAAATVVDGSGPVAVAGRSAVGIARQPLTEESAEELEPPRSLFESLHKDEDALSDVSLWHEIDLIEQWIANDPLGPDSFQLGRELDLLKEEALARAGRRARQASRERPKPKEGTAARLIDIVHEGRLDVEEVAKAHKSFRSTGLVPRTSRPFARVEIESGTAMSRSGRYDAMLKKQGKAIAVWRDIDADDRDPDFLTAEEFVDEFWSREKAERQWCQDEYFRPGPRSRCRKAVEAKYGGSDFVAWKKARDRWTARQIEITKGQIDNVASSGAVATAGRVGGYVTAKLAGRDDDTALRWSEHGAAILSVGDLLLPAKAAKTQRMRLQNYSAGGGLEVRRDASTFSVDARSSRVAPKPTAATTGPDQSATGSTRLTAAEFDARLAALQVPAGKSAAFAKAADTARRQLAKDPDSAERMLQGMEDRFAVRQESVVTQLFAEAQQKLFAEKGATGKYRQSTAADDRAVLDQAAPSGKDVLKARVRESERLGVAGGREQAAKEDITVRDWDTPQQWKGEFGKGPDALGARGDKRQLLEFKGGSSGLGVSNGVVEMSNTWAGRKIAELEAVGDTAVAADLLKAARAGNLQGMVYRTRQLKAGETTSRLKSHQLRDRLQDERIRESGLIEYSPTKVERAYQQRLRELRRAIEAGDLRGLRNL